MLCSVETHLVSTVSALLLPSLSLSQSKLCREREERDGHREHCLLALPRREVQQASSPVNQRYPVNADGCLCVRVCCIVHAVLRSTMTPRPLPIELPAEAQ